MNPTDNTTHSEGWEKELEKGMVSGELFGRIQERVEYIEKVKTFIHELISKKEAEAQGCFEHCQKAFQEGKDTADKELLEALESMYEQYCDNGHSFMSAGEGAMAVMKEYGYGFDGGGRLISYPASLPITDTEV